jgi:hypothetical protein
MLSRIMNALTILVVALGVIAVLGASAIYAYNAYSEAQFEHGLMHELAEQP